jgi:hypothetical protein
MKWSSFVLASVLIMFATGAVAGSLDAPSAPASTNTYTVDDIYNRLNDGTPGSQSTFTGPPPGAIGGTGHTLNDVMGKAPAKDDTNGALPTHVKPGKTFWGLNRAAGKWGLQTGERFTDNGNGTVTDNLTGLVWLKNANCFGSKTWTQGLSDANNLADGGCGLTDGSTAGQWRMPNIFELQSVTDLNYYTPALTSGHPFSGVQTNKYWSSTTSAEGPSRAWYVDMDKGFVYDGDNKSTSFYVWPVR